MKQSLNDLKQTDTVFYPWQLEIVINGKEKNVVLFDILDNFTNRQGNILALENISSKVLTQNESIERLDDLKENNITVVLYGEDLLKANGPWMLFRQVGFDNVKVLLGGYQYYEKHKDNLSASKNDSTLLKGNPKYNFAGIISEMGGVAASEQSSAKKSVVVQRKQKAAAAAGGC